MQSIRSETGNESLFCSECVNALAECRPIRIFSFTFDCWLKWDAKRSVKTKPQKRVTTEISEEKPV